MLFMTCLSVQKIAKNFLLLFFLNLLIEYKEPNVAVLN